MSVGAQAALTGGQQEGAQQQSDTLLGNDVTIESENNDGTNEDNSALTGGSTDAYLENSAKLSHDEWKKGINLRIKDWATGPGFQKYKFLPDEEHWNVNSKFFEECMNACYQRDTDKLSWKQKKLAVWNMFGKHARNKLTRRRNNVVRSVQLKFKDLLKTEKVECHEDYIASLLQGPKKKPAEYSLFLLELCRGCVKDTVWRDNVLSSDYTDFLKPGDEAFVWLMVENYGAMWSDEYSGKMTDLEWTIKNSENKEKGLPGLEISKKARDAKYSSGGRGSKKQGWSKDGRERFNLLGMSVCINRKAYPDFYTGINKIVKEKAEGKGKKRKPESSSGTIEELFTGDSIKKLRAGDNDDSDSDPAVYHSVYGTMTEQELVELCGPNCFEPI